MKRDLLSLSDITRDEVEALLKSAARLKTGQPDAPSVAPLAGKSLGMLFNKASTRTRISFEVGITQLGGHAVALTGEQLQMKRGETVADTARIFSRYLDGLIVRTFAHQEVVELAADSDIPVINALTDMYHPCQILADLFTIQEKRGKLTGIKVAYIGDGNNVANSWLLGAAMMGVNLSIATPDGYRPHDSSIGKAKDLAAETGALIEIGDDPAFAAKNADVLYTDTWISMGQEGEADARREAFKGFQVDSKLLGKAKPDALVMHCLPAHRGEEITAEVLDGPNSVVWDQAENRLHVQKAILMLLLG